MPAKSIAQVKLVSIDLPSESAFDDGTWLLRAVSTWSSDTLFFFSAVDVERGSSIEALLSEVPPRTDGTRAIEFGLILPDLLPSMEGRHEYALTVGLEGASPKALYFSNAMGRIVYQEQEGLFHGVLPRYFSASLKGYPGSTDLAALAVESLRTMVTARYDLRPYSGSQDIVDQVDMFLNDLVARLNAVVGAMLALGPVGPALPLPRYERTTFPAAYFMVIGAEPETIRHGRLVLNTGATVGTTRNFDADLVDTLRRVVEGSEVLDPARYLLASARSYASSGNAVFAMLVAAIAAELATLRFVDRRLRAQGVSRGKLKEHWQRVDFALALNVLVPALMPDGTVLSKDTIGRVDRLRKIRNDYMHYAKFQVTANDVVRAIEAVEELMTKLSPAQSHSSPTDGSEEQEE